MSAETDAKRSPLKEQPLHTPGQGLEEQVRDLAYGRMLMWMMAIVITLVWAGAEWLQWAMKAPPMPGPVTGIAVVFCAVAVWRIRVLFLQARQLMLGLMGEKYVGQWLEEHLGPKGYRVFHDIVGDRGNIDHVVVGPTGVYAIETKTFRVPTGRRSQVVSHGESLTVDGIAPDRNPIDQARAAAGNLADILQKMAGREVFVRPVVLFPGWYTKHKRGSDVWVLDEKGLLGFLRNEKTRLPSEDIHLFADRVATYVRGRDKMA